MKKIGLKSVACKRALLGFCGNLMPNCHRPPAGVLFPYAHIVNDNPPLHVRHLYAIPSMDKFKSDLDFLCRRYRPLQLSELERIPGLSRHEQRPRYFVLSFDDGMREIYDVIAPILRSKGVPAIFFLNSATIDNKRLMWRHKVSLLIEHSKQLPSSVLSRLKIQNGEGFPDKLRALRFADEGILDDLARSLEIDFNEYLRRAQPYLTTSQILSLARSGFEFGAHSESHPLFNELAVNDQKRQICHSVQFIRMLGLPCRYFSFPFHDSGVSRAVFDYMRELGLVMSFGSSEGRLDPIAFSFQRFALDADSSKVKLQGLLKQLSAKSFLRRLSRTEMIVRN